ncbi:class I SAM-dependent methyltransferase [Tissierella carlieri]|uniref:Class I SAM-dependent methyltransferase n=1 Tax=Tissierella carlieri TaxID=689904 RepID=A0ABT1SCB8_9FIRM|nr:class I SAM-dependent methyltransferase [Tissierella carlieri]MCQ4923612.1 class I SAM-dependent methyltransferase [Tissierella carlieri]
MKKYYHAYEERYKKIHGEGLLWFSKEPTPELISWIEYYDISVDDEICEVGCGEGRDALYLAEQGYKITGVDISEEAIKKCEELSKERRVNVNWIVSDALQLNEKLKKHYDWIYSVGTLHMLVEDEDRKRFLNTINSLLNPKGKLLLISMGDGEIERKTEIETAFDLQERSHMKSGKTFEVASTSYRAINWKNHREELEDAGFIVEKIMNTENEEYSKCMTVYLTKD